MEEYTARVVRVIDGDTIVVVVIEVFHTLESVITVESKQPKIVRIKGIDTPEKREPLYGEATQFTKDKTLGKAVQLVTDGKYDRYGRVLAYVKTEAGDLGELLMQAGLAREWTD